MQMCREDNGWSLRFVSVADTLEETGGRQKKNLYKLHLRPQRKFLQVDRMMDYWLDMTFPQSRRRRNNSVLAPTCTPDSANMRRTGLVNASIDHQELKFAVCQDSGCQAPSQILGLIQKIQTLRAFVLPFELFLFCSFIRCQILSAAARPPPPLLLVPRIIR